MTQGELTHGEAPRTMCPNHPAVAFYLELLQSCLTDELRPESFVRLHPGKGGLLHTVKRASVLLLQSLLRPLRLELVRRAQYDPSTRREGKDWPAEAETMIGRKRLSQLQRCIEEVLREHIPGDLIECGVWRGGATIFMRAVPKAYGDVQRQVWVADSFKGLPPPDAENYYLDKDDRLHRFEQLSVSLEEVEANFTRYGLLDDQVQFLPGWFKDSLPTASIDRLAVLRADGDMYESTTQILTYLYPKLSVGGYCIIDDYGAGLGCRQATDDYRRQQGVTEPLQWIDWSGVFWQRTV
jgi:O-methyltransferase